MMTRRLFPYGSSHTPTGASCNATLLRDTNLSSRSLFYVAHSASYRNFVAGIYKTKRIPLKPKADRRAKATIPLTETEMPQAQAAVEDKLASSDKAVDEVEESKEQAKDDSEFGVLLQAGDLEDDDSDEYIE